MRGRYKRRGRAVKLLFVLAVLFLFSVWNYYRDNTGIFYTHTGMLVTVVFGSGLTIQRVRQKKKKRQPSFVRSAQYTKSRIGQSETLRRFRAALIAQGIVSDLDRRICRKCPRRKKRAGH